MPDLATTSAASASVPLSGVETALRALIDRVAATVAVTSTAGLSTTLVSAPLGSEVPICATTTMLCCAASVVPA